MTKQGQTITDRKICLPSHAKINAASITVNNAGAETESTTVTLSNLGNVDHAMLITIVDQNTACPTGLSMSP